MTTFDLADLVDIGPGELAPPNTRELVPGLALPDPTANQLHPGTVTDSNVRFPLYASDIKVRQPGELGPFGMTELGDRTGVWVPNPRMNTSRPGYYTPPAGEKPIQLEDIKYLRPGEHGPRGYVPLGDTGVWIPGPETVAKNVDPASKIAADDTDQADHGKSGNDIFGVNYRHLEGLANNHEGQAGQVSQWANTDADFADRLLATHGKVAYATYLNAKAFNETRTTEANAYAQRNSDTAIGLRNAINATRSTDEASAAAFQPPSTRA
ncbi:type VII secretion target [Mycolicibacterium fortuitum]|uniref:Type VII secretion target n=2 Tax=Mycolicibacterium fortuitum TaxID=1766 RepID=A0AAE4VL25_MYCFO|nr:type VII secretion target [Mycolicibacterium fortuitum]MCV7144254.1 ESX-1 secretion-associated protein [Mycolicibacterium fortuitum]MDV7195356.1 type VII secretion target [Mycolicibacterium fortuitum]MDV7209059.1 type VII secretion target [Mycolicibacterium fortuitum]MDV7230899.1 type VII secretion target [Mycolicibacterium fortuitum]MDV7262470.1 type VII secretion target [Mycolicibacterium fortuitum]